jgi:HTH-type transcriptional regulator/antitoxin HipB
MPKAIHSLRQKRMSEFLVERRREAGLTQAQVARALGRHQPFIANIESGERRLDVVELLDLASVIGFDAHDLISDLEHLPIRRGGQR